MIQRVTENIKVTTARCIRLQTTVHNKRHPLLGQSSMRAQRVLQAGQIMLFGSAAQNMVMRADNNEVANAVGRQPE